MKIKGNKWLLAVLVLGVTLGLLSCSQTMKQTKKDSYTEEELGLRQETLYDESTTVPAHGETTTNEPGQSTKFERSFENSPPLIPHDIKDMLPLEVTDNICMGCHMPEEVEDSGATSIPRSHLVNLGTGEDLKGRLDGGRINCLQCHVIQNILDPAVENIFKGEFRDERGRYRSNLLDILNEGVEAE